MSGRNDAGVNHDKSRMVWRVNGRVLVVDDEPLVRKVARMTLEKAGYDLLEAENGERASEAINSNENPLVLDIVNGILPVSEP
jgi:DNA-binding NtrC family response regulator